MLNKINHHNFRPMTYITQSDSPPSSNQVTSITSLKNDNEFNNKILIHSEKITNKQQKNSVADYDSDSNSDSDSNVNVDVNVNVKMSEPLPANTAEMRVGGIESEYNPLKYTSVDKMKNQKNKSQLEDSKPIIYKEDRYFLDRKLISIHSEDRDTTSWSNINEFEVRLPERMTNVHSIRLVDISLPNKIYNIHNSYQNTKLAWNIDPQYSVVSEPDKAGLNSKFISGIPYTITLDNGSYQPDELALLLQTLMNNEVTNYLIDNHGLASSYEYNHIIVRYSHIMDKFIFMNNRDIMVLQFDYEFTYTDCSPKINMFSQSENWGLPYLLGYEKATYQDTSFSQLSQKILLKNDGTVETIEPGTTAYNAYSILFYLEAPNKQRLFNDNVIYVELDRYNTMDELKPYVSSTNTYYDNDYNGVVNSAFAKISLQKENNYVLNNTGNSMIHNIALLRTAVPTIEKMKFKFRYHDGRLVEFSGQPINFTVEINQLIDDYNPNYKIRNIPHYE